MSKRIAQRILLLGWDAADWKVITPLLDAGKMPFLEKLINGGVMGNLATLKPILSPILWNSIATGKRADKHGILGFIEPRPDGKGVQPVSSTSRRCKAFWNILPEQGMQVSVVGWFASHPAEKVNGTIVTNQFQNVTGTDFESWPLPPGAVYPESQREVFTDLRFHPTEIDTGQILHLVPRAAEVDQEKDRRLAVVGKLFAEVGTVHAAGTYLAENSDWDVLTVYYDSIDHFCHAFMEYRAPRMEGVTEEDFEIYKDVVDNIYLFHDLMLGRYMELVGDDTTTIIVSDHGYHSDALRPPVQKGVPEPNPPRWHREYGIIVAAGPGIKADERVYGATLLDITPTILALLDQPVARDMDGRILRQICEPPLEPDYIDTYETAVQRVRLRETPRAASPFDGGAVNQPVSETVEVGTDDVRTTKAALQQLAALGYIDPLSENAEQAIKQATRYQLENLAQVQLSARHYEKAAKILSDLTKQYAAEAPGEPPEIDPNVAEAQKAAVLRSRMQFQRQKNQNLQQQLWLAQCYLMLGRFNPCREIVAEVLQNLPDAPFANFLYGQILFQEGNDDAALRHLQAAQKADPRLPNLHLRIGAVYVRKKLWAEAEAAFQRALEIDGDNAAAYDGLGIVYYNLDRYEDALEQIMRSVSLLHHQPQAHYHLGLTTLALGQVDWAIRAFEVAIEQRPKFKAAHERLAELYEAHGEAEKADGHRDPASVPIKERREKASTPQGVQPTAHPENSITIVSGLPRSGTSLMMQMLEAGGMESLTDGERRADEDNPRGYYELEGVKRLRDNPECLAEAEGKAVKVVSMLLQTLPSDRQYKVIFMHRKLEQIVASQAKMTARQGTALEDQPHIEMLHVHYHDMLNDPAGEAQKVNQFLGNCLRTGEMGKVVDPTLYRQRQ